MTPPAGALTLTGNVVDVQPATGDEITGFTVQVGAEKHQVLIDAERSYGFPLAHLRDHQASDAPVMVIAEKRANALYALAVEDA